MPRRSARIAELNNSRQIDIPVPDIVSAPARVRPVAPTRNSPSAPDPIQTQVPAQAGITKD
jgi:hypothetical protein